MNEQIPDFIKNLGNKEDAELATSQKGFVDNGTKQIPDFISKPINKQSDIELTSTQPNYKDIEVRQEIGVDFDNSFSSNQEAVKEYVDNLSAEDYKTWTQLKDEGYSLDARKAMFDNKDNLYDITAKGNEKFWSGQKNSFMQYLLDQQKNTLDFQNEVIHPWSQTYQEKLDTLSQNLMKPTYEDIYNKLETDYSGNPWNKSMAGVLRGVNVAGSILSTLGSKGLQLIDSFGNLSTQLGGELLNKIADDKKGYDKFIVDPSESVSMRASQIEAVNSVLGGFYAIKYPVATFMMTTVLGESDRVKEIMDKSYKGIKRVTQQVEDILGTKNLGVDNLSEKDKELWYENIAMTVMGIFGEMLGFGGKKLSNTKTVQNFESAVQVAREVSEFSKNTTKKEIAQGVKGAMEDLPEGSQFTTEGGTPLFTKTTGGIKPTTQGSLYLLTKIYGAKANGFIRGLEWVYRNKDRWLVTRNPKEPVGDLPVTPGVKIDNETPKVEDTRIKPVEEPKVEAPKQEIKTTTPKTVATTKPEVSKPVEKTSTIKEFIKSVKEDFESPNSGISKELSEKIQTSPALQSEYVNTIDPYIRANGATNPSGVIEQPLRDFVNTVLEELNYQRFSEIDQNRINQQTKINIPVQEKVRYESQQKEYKDLINILSKDYDNSEEYLKYLLNLKPETVKTLDRLIPDFSKNLGLIKDTLDLTKAITSTDLLGKLLDWKSNWGGRNKASIRNYLWRKFAEAYKNSSTKTRMAEVENILNQMSEEELVNLEKQMEGGDLRKRGDDIDWRSEGYMKETFGEKGNRSLQSIMDSKRPGTDKTVREYLKDKGVKITVTDADSQYRQLTHEMRGNESLAAYSENLDRMILKRFDNPYKGFIFHEFGHRLFNQLGTNQMLDMLEYISKRDNISQEAAFERRAEYFRNYMEYNNIDGKRYILKELGEAFDPKLLQVMEKTKNEIFDLFNIKDTQELEINQIMSDVKHDTEAGKEITSRKPQPLLNRRVGDDVDWRAEFLKKIDPEVEKIRTDYDKPASTPYDKADIVIQKKDGTTETWSEFKKKMTEEQLKEIDKYEEDALDDIIGDLFKIDTEEGFVGEGKFDYNTLKNKNALKDLLKDGYNKTKEELGLESIEAIDLYQQLKQIDPDIVGLGEKDGQLSVKYLIEGYSERRELPDRPGQLELKEVPAYDYFTEEEKAKLPKEIQDRIGNPGENIDNEGNILSKQQEEYFKDSEVRNDKGELIVVYHGSRNSNFDEFNPSYVGSSNGNEGFFGAGMYFTDDKAIAADYMRSGRSNKESIPGIKAGYLNIKKMFDFDKTYSKEEYDNLLKELGVTKYELPADEYKDGKYRLMNGYDLEFFTNQEMDMDKFHEIFGDDIEPDEILQGRDLTRVLQEAGYDGAYGDSGTTRERVIFNSNQFKPLSNKVPYDTGKFSDKELVTKVLDEIKK